jgi:RNase P/RNase MRP subunit POP5
MAFTAAEKKEIEVLMRKEIKDFLGSQTVKQFENKLMDDIAKDIKRGKLESEIKELIVRSMSEFYGFLWNQKTTWEGRVRRA